MSAIQLYRDAGEERNLSVKAKPHQPSLAEKISCVEIDALPYIDGEFNDASMRTRVNQLVSKEMHSFKPPDYLKMLELKTVSREGPQSELIQEEMRRMERGETMKPLSASVDPPPPSLANDLGAWQSSIRTAQTQLAYQHNRVLNLELLTKYGSSVWVDALRHTEALTEKTKGQLDDVQKKVHALNAKRKIEQTAVKPSLDKNKFDWWNLTVKNQQIQTASQMFEQVIKKQRSESST